MDYAEHVESLKRERIQQDRLNHMEDYHEEDFLEQYMHTKGYVTDQLYVIEEPLMKMRKYDYHILPNTQLPVTLRFYATSGFWKLAGDLFGIQVYNMSWD